MNRLVPIELVILKLDFSMSNSSSFGPSGFDPSSLELPCFDPSIQSTGAGSTMMTSDLDFDQFRIQRDAAMMHMALNELDPFVQAFLSEDQRGNQIKPTSVPIFSLAFPGTTSEFSPLIPPVED